MPLINVQPRDMQDGTRITYFNDSVGTSSTTYTFAANQEMIMLRNKGSKDINYTIGASSGALGRGELIKVNGSFSSVVLSSSQGTQAFEIISDEIGTISGSADYTNLASQVAERVKTVNGVAPDASGNVVISTGSGGGSLVYSTLAALQAAYPGGSTQPAWVAADNSWYYWSGTITSPADTTAPTLTITAGGNFTGTKSVTMSANETATIYYTTDGNTPTTSSSVYSTALSLSATTTVKAFAKDTAGNSSSVQTVTYTLDTGGGDTTPPVLTITPAATFTDTKTVTMSTDETATIYYTLDDSDPKVSGTKLTYTVPLTLTETDTIKAYAKDAANNESAVQTVTYTKQAGFTEGTNALQLNGTSDYLEYNDFSYDTLEMSVNLDSTGTGYLMDGRSQVGSGISNLYLLTGSVPPAPFSDIKVNDVSVTKDASTVANFPRGTRTKLTFVFTSALGGTATTVLFGRGASYYNQWFKAKVYSVKLYKTGVLQAHWDFTNQTGSTSIVDQTGNNHVLNRVTGTWV